MYGFSIIYSFNTSQKSCKLLKKMEKTQYEADIKLRIEENMPSPLSSNA